MFAIDVVKFGSKRLLKNRMAPVLSKQTLKYAVAGTVTISTLVWLLKKKGRKHSAKSR